MRNAAAHRLTGPEPRVYRAPSLPKPPRHLSAEARRRWRALTGRGSALRDEGAQQILRAALEALDRALSSTAAAIAAGRGRRSRNSLWATEAASVAGCRTRRARGGISAGLRMLNLDLEPLRDRPGRPGGG